MDKKKSIASQYLLQNIFYNWHIISPNTYIKNDGNTRMKTASKKTISLHHSPFNLFDVGKNWVTKKNDSEPLNRKIFSKMHPSMDPIIFNGSKSSLNEIRPYNTFKDHLILATCIVLPYGMILIVICIVFFGFISFASLF